MTPSPIGARHQKPLAMPQEDPIMISLPDLLAGVEAAEGPDREIDAEIAVALSGDPEAWVVNPSPQSIFGPVAGWWRTGDDKSHDAPTYTASLDAALGLVERVLPGFWWDLDCRGWAHIGPEYRPLNMPPGSWGKTPALAILSALLKALIAKEADMASSSPSDPLSGLQP
jgi:hypothetical protein